MPESIRIPQIIEGGIPSYESMWGNAVVPVAKSIITSYATNMMRQYLYGARLAESRDLAADLADITSFSKAAPQWKDPDLLGASIEELQNLADEYGANGEFLQQKYALANIRLMDPYLDTLEKQEEVRGIRDDMEDLLGDLVGQPKMWVGPNPEALKLLDKLDNRLSDLEQYQSVNVARDADSIYEDTALTMSAYNMLTSLDDDQLLEGTQIKSTSFPTPESYDKAVDIKNTIYSSLAGGHVSKQGVRDAFSLMNSLRTDLRVANNAELRTKNTIRAQMSNDIDNWLTLFDVSYPKSDDKMESMFGKTLGGDDPTKGLLTNLRSLVAGKNEVTPDNFAFLNNVALREMAKIVLTADNVPEKITEAAKAWQDVGLHEHDRIMAGNFYKQIAHWEKDAAGMSSGAEGWNKEFIGEKMSGEFWESDEDKNIKNVAIRWNNFLEELYKMRIQAGELFPEQPGWLEGIGAQNIQPTYGSALEQALR